MKTKTEPPKDTTNVTTTAKLTIRGTAFELSLEELEHIYGLIGEALGKKKSAPVDLNDFKKLAEEMRKKREKETPPPMWPIPMPYVPPINLPIPGPYRGPQTPPYEVWCIVGDDSRADPHIKLLRSSYPLNHGNL